MHQCLGLCVALQIDKGRPVAHGCYEGSAHLLEGLDEACRQELIAHPAAYIRVLNRHTSYEPAAW